MNSSVSAFKKKVRNFYTRYGRHTLPWRKTKNPYRILVSEIMLQQTQVERVIPKYKEFLKTFPTIQTLSDASLVEVLRLWSGLGYNRRAQMLHTAARQIISEYKGTFPKSVVELEKLSGVGPYTARAIAAFAYNQPVAMIETNIRTVFIHEFFKDTQEEVSDAEINVLIEKAVDTENSREWYAALMDYGSYLKKAYPNPSRKSKHHTKQSKFKGSLREVRGKILPMLLENSATEEWLVKESGFTEERVRNALEGLRKDALVHKIKNKWKVFT